MPGNEFDRTEAPTLRRRNEARKEGNVARSSDLTAASVLLASVLLLYFLGQRFIGGMQGFLEQVLLADAAVNPTRADDLPALFVLCGKTVLTVAGPLVLAVTAAALIATVGQVGFLFTTTPLKPNFSRLSPVRGVARLVDIRAGMRLVMSLAKVFIIALVASLAIMHDLPRIIHLARLETVPMFSAAAQTVFALGVKLAVLLMLLAILDYAFQRWQRERDLRMTKQDVKDELKRMEGDPLIKQRRARVARQLSLQRIGQSVPHGDVVVTNPTHFAVVLKYDSEFMKAPKVVAKGADYLALRIRQLAIGHGVPMVERKELARAICDAVEVGQEVPPQFYNTVAEILAYVYRLSGQKTA